MNAAEEAVGVVDLASLVLPVQTGEGLEPDEKVVKDCGIGVHGTIKKADFAVACIDLPQSGLELAELLVVELARRQRKVAQVVLIAVELLVQLPEVISPIEIGNHPRHHRVLSQVVVCSSRVAVDKAQILEVAELSLLPLLCKSGFGELLLPVFYDLHLCFAQLC